MVRPDRIKYLTFEGGGGKGLLYPGAIMSLYEVGAIRYEYLGDRIGPTKLSTTKTIGISGSSAGAITALLLSCGYTPTEILLIMDIEDKAAFFDVDAFLFPLPGGCRHRHHPGAIELHAIAYPEGELGRGRLFEVIETLIDLIVSATSPSVDTLRRIVEALQAHIEAAPFILGLLSLFDNVPPAALASIRANRVPTAISLHDHYGLFAGCAIREFLNKWIAVARFRITEEGIQYWEQKYSQYQTSPGVIRDSATGVPYPDNEARARVIRKILESLSDYYIRARSLRVDNLESLDPIDEVFLRGMNTSLLDHKDAFGVELFITGSNIEKKVTEIFSAFDFPSFPVADAVRISLSLPGVFKPLVLRPPILQSTLGLSRGVTTNLLNGVWMDGGFYNNLPWSVFQIASPRRSRITIEQILGLRLIDDPNPPVNNLTGYASAWFGTGIFGAGESQLSQTLTTNTNIIQLEPFGLTTFDFDPDRSTIRQALVEAQVRVRRAFARPSAISEILQQELDNFQGALDSFFSP